MAPKKFIREENGKPVSGAVAFPANAEDEETLIGNGWVEEKPKAEAKPPKEEKPKAEK